MPPKVNSRNDNHLTATTNILNNNNSTSRSSSKPVTPVSFATFEDDFFASFNNNFERNTQKSPFSYTPQPIAAAAFGDSTTTSFNNQTSSASEFSNAENLFNANFEDEFAKISIASPKTTAANNSTTTNNNKTIGTFGKFDAFEDGKFDAFSASTADVNLRKNETLNAKHITDRFAGDYSKTDTFDTDLQDVLQRSLIDQ